MIEHITININNYIVTICRLCRGNKRGYRQFLNDGEGWDLPKRTYWRWSVDNTHTGTVQSAVVTVRNEVANVMFLQACVCPQGGGVSGPRGGLVWGGVSAPGGVVWSRGWLLRGGGCSGRAEWWCLLRGGWYPSMHWGRPPPGETATAADGTDPTGMHSCYQTFCWSLLWQNISSYAC